MPATATVAPKPAASNSRSTLAVRAPTKVASGPKPEAATAHPQAPVPQLPAFARSSLPPPTPVAAHDAASRAVEIVGSKPAPLQMSPPAPVIPKPAGPKPEVSPVAAKSSVGALPAFVRAMASPTPAAAPEHHAPTLPASSQAITQPRATKPPEPGPSGMVPTISRPEPSLHVQAAMTSSPVREIVREHVPSDSRAAALASGRPPLPPTAHHQRPEAKPPKPLASKKQEVSPPGHVLPPEVKSAIEDSYSINLDGVEFHADSHAQAAAASFSARAFAYGKHIFLGRNEKLKDLQLIAHEAAHVVQQQSVPTVLRWAPGQSDAFEMEADQAASAVMRGEKFAITGRVSKPRVQRWSPLKWVREHVADLAYNIPGYRLLTVLIGKDPITSADVDRSAANILRGLVELVPGVGHQIEKALDQYGVFDKIGGWIEQQIQKMFAVGSAIKKDWDDFVDDLGWTDVAHPIRVVEDALGVFKRAIERIGKFVAGVISDILEMLKQAILVPLAKLIKDRTSAWDLLTAVLGKDPITGEKVDDSPEAVIGGFMKLIHEDEVWNNIKKANAISRAWNWFKGALKELLGFVSQIPSLFIDALKSLTIEDILLLPKGVIKVIKVFVGFGIKFISWAGQKVWDLLQIIFEVVAPGAMPYLRKVGAAIRSILKHPIVFVGHLVDAGKLGFHLFKEHFAAHLKKSFFEWLTNSLKGVYIPKSFELRELVKFVLSVLGLTWENIRAKLVKVVGETAVKAMETGFDIVVTLVKEGPAAAWEKIVEQLSNLQDMVVKAIMDFVVVTVVQRAVTQIAALLVPGAAFIQAIIAIYDTIKVFIERLSKIIEVAKAFLDSLIEIVSGKIAGAARKVEDTLAGMLTMAISFLAGFLHLGSLADKVLEIIQKIRTPIDKALDKVIDWIVTMAKKVGGWFAAKAKSAAGGIAGLLGLRKQIRLTTGETHTLSFTQQGERLVLMAASNPVPFRDFIAGIGARTFMQDEKRVAILMVNKIDSLEDDTKATGHDHNDEIVALLESLGKIATELMNAAYGHDIRTTPPVYAGLRDGFGRGMRVMLATDALGSGTPPSTTSPTWADLNARRSGNGVYYVRGHLLNEGLGGPGGTWENLTPLSLSGNAQHEKRAESIIKPTRGDPPRFFLYVVTPSYGRAVNTALIGRINSAANPDPPATKSLKERIVRAEAGVPTNMICSITEMDAMGRTGGGLINDTYTIENEIDQSDPSRYQV